jgi:hypothetical protein
MLLVSIALLMSMLCKQELLEVVYVPKVEAILGVFTVLQLCIGQSPKYTSSMRSKRLVLVLE